MDADGDELGARLVKGPTHGDLNLDNDGSFRTGRTTVSPASTASATRRRRHCQRRHAGHADGHQRRPARPQRQLFDEGGHEAPRRPPGRAQERRRRRRRRPHGRSPTAVPARTLDLRPRGEFDYEPAQGFAGTDVFTYRAVDGADQSAVVRVIIDVAPKATPPPTPTPAPTAPPSPDPTPAADAATRRRRPSRPRCHGRAGADAESRRPTRSRRRAPTDGLARRRHRRRTGGSAARPGKGRRVAGGGGVDAARAVDRGARRSPRRRTSGWPTP